MAKRRRNIYRGIKPEEITRYQAENLARSAMDVHPKVRQIRDEITDAVVKATAKAMKCFAKKKA